MNTVKVPALALRLHGQQQRAYLTLHENGEQDTETLKNQGIGSPSLAAKQLNAKFAAWGIPSRIICEMRPHTNAYGERGVIGYWRLVETDDQHPAAA